MFLELIVKGSDENGCQDMSGIFLLNCAPTTGRSLSSVTPIGFPKGIRRVPRIHPLNRALSGLSIPFPNHCPRGHLSSVFF